MLYYILMCFTIPYRVEKIKDGIAVVEGGEKIKLNKYLSVKKGEYLQVTGNIAVAKISRDEGLRIRNLIKTIYEGN